MELAKRRVFGSFPGNRRLSRRIVARLAVLGVVLSFAGALSAATPEPIVGDRSPTFGRVTVVSHPGRIDTSATAGAATVGYSNTTDIGLFRPGIGVRIADDLFISGAGCGCNLDSFEFTVSGNGNGAGPGFSVDFALYTACPSTGGQMIPGTQGSVALPDDGLHVVTYAYTGDPLTIPISLWMALEFDQANAGWRAGGMPEVGFSADFYDLNSQPGLNCSAAFSPAFYASFAARVLCSVDGPPNVFAPNPPDGAVAPLLNPVLNWNGFASTAGTASTGGAQPQLVNPGNFECGTVGIDDSLKQFQAAVAAGEIPDPATKKLPNVAPRSWFGGPAGGVAGGGIPTVTSDDIFLYEDTSQVLLSNFGFGQLTNLMVDAANDLLAIHGDNFDFIGYFLNFVPDHQIGGAFYQPIFNDVQGIGLGQSNLRNAYGLASTEIEGLVMMWNQINWGTGQFSTTQLVLGQEFEHRFGMFLSPLTGNRPLQGNDASCGRGAHWNFNVDGQASGMEMREWTGSSPATRLGGTLNFNTDIGGVFSYPDLYIMGYVFGSEMDSMASELRYMNNNTNCPSSYSGTISNWTSADIVATNGTRIPNAALAQKHFNTAWVMFHLPGSPPSSFQLSRVVTMLNRWSQMYELSTLGRGTMSNVLAPPEAPGACTATYDVRLGTTNPPTLVTCAEVVEPMCDPGILDSDTEYYWQVTATTADTVRVGPVWSFVTTCPIVGSTPDNCSGDARLPHATNDSADVFGSQSFVLQLDCPIATIGAGDFSLEIDGQPVAGIDTVDVTGSNVVVNLVAPIPPGSWTCIRRNLTQSDSCFGFLPGDVDNNLTSSPSDVVAAMAALDGSNPLPDGSVDSDRNGVQEPADLLRLVEILIGAGELQTWSGSTLSTCPAFP